MARIRTRTIVVRVKPELRTALEKMAIAESRTLSNLVVLLLERAVLPRPRKEKRS